MLLGEQKEHLNKKKKFNARNATRPRFERSLVLYLSNKNLNNSKSSRSALPNLYYLGFLLPAAFSQIFNAPTAVTDTLKCFDFLLNPSLLNWLGYILHYESKIGKQFFQCKTARSLCGLMKFNQNAKHKCSSLTEFKSLAVNQNT